MSEKKTTYTHTQPALSLAHGEIVTTIIIITTKIKYAKARAHTHTHIRTYPKFSEAHTKVEEKNKIEWENINKKKKKEEEKSSRDDYST